MALIWKQLDCVLALLGASILLLMLLPSVIGKNDTSSDSDGPTPRHTLFFDEATEFSKEAHNYNCRFYSNDKTGENGGGKLKMEKGFTREFCGCTKKDGKPSDGFQFPPVNFTCLTSFYKVAFMPMCGNEWYDQMKMCSLVHFFNDNKEEMKSVKEDVQKKTLILLDGCATCTQGGAKITGFKVTHSEEAGGFFSKCSAEEEFVAMEQSVDIGLSAGTDVNQDTRGFTLPVVLYHRICDNVFSKTTPPEEYKNVKLHVKHNCGGGEKTLVIDLPSIELGKGFFGNNAAELRGLALHLDNQGTKEQYRMEGEDYSEPPKYVPGKPNEFKWEDAHVECWTKDNQCDWLMKN